MRNITPGQDDSSLLELVLIEDEETSKDKILEIVLLVCMSKPSVWFLPYESSFSHDRARSNERTMTRLILSHKNDSFVTFVVDVKCDVSRYGLILPALVMT